MRIYLPNKRKLPAIVLILVLGGITLTSSVAAMGKIVETFKVPTKPLPQLESTEEAEEDKLAIAEVETELSEKETEIGKSQATSMVKNTPKNSPSNKNRCLVTLFGKQYDVAPLKNTHSGGDIFVCNTDMSATYQSQHGTDVSRMGRYLVISGLQSPTPSVTNNSQIPSTVANNPNQCLITLFGQVYDVSPLRKAHPGGDVFVCNSDMSATYQSQHGTNVSSMQQYLVSGTGSASTPATASSGSGWTRSEEEHDDEEDRWEAEKKAMEAAIEAAKKAAEQDHEEN